MNNENLTPIYDNSGDHYPEFESVIKDRFNEVVESRVPLFKTSVEGLSDIFLANLPVEARHHYNCRACLTFLNRYGDLVTISQDGDILPVMWDLDRTPSFFLPAVTAMRSAILKSRVSGVFLTSDRVLGQPVTGEWTHISVTLPSQMVYRSLVTTAGQKMAEKREDRRILIDALNKFSSDVVDQALTLLESEALYRSDKVLGVAKWFKEQHTKRAATENSKQRDNLLWLAVATAPEGFCHINSSMIGTLLEDIAEGLSFTAISRRFAEKMNPSNYMRAQSAPTQGAVEHAEQLIQRSEYAPSLPRRYATSEEIPTFLWKPETKNSPAQDASRSKANASSGSSGVFGHIVPKGATPASNRIDLPTTTMTWEKFARTILPSVTSIEAKVDDPNRLMAMVTAVDPDAPNMLLWDNPFSWYYHGGVDGKIKRRVELAGGRYENNEIRCSLIWEGLTDLDLHCVTPKGSHIYYSEKKGRCGGYLDLDMNGLDKKSEEPVENMRWADNAPQGHYEFYVHNYNERVNGRYGTPFKVELEVNGQVYHYEGAALRERDQVTVFEFTYVRGQQPVFRNKVPKASEGAWSIPVGSFVPVTGITNSPNQWGDRPVTHTGHHVFFLLENCRDLSEGKGRGFFAEMLKSDLREIRKVLEAYTASTPIEGVNEASASGVGFSKDSEWNLILKVKTNGSERLIKIDRWD